MTDQNVARVVGIGDVSNRGRGGDHMTTIGFLDRNAGGGSLDNRRRVNETSSVSGSPLPI